MIPFKISGLDPAPFRHLYGLSDAELQAQAVVRYEADKADAYPDRIELRNADPGETVKRL